MLPIYGYFSIIGYGTTFQICNVGGNGVGIGTEISISPIGPPNVAAHDPFFTCSIHSRTLTRDCKAEAAMEI